MKKLIKEALKDLKMVKENMPSLYDHTIEHWIKMAYLQGEIDILEERLKKTKHEYL